MQGILDSSEEMLFAQKRINIDTVKELMFF